MAVARVAWDQLSRGAKDTLMWARAAEANSDHVGTCGLFIGMLRSGEDPANALLRHFGVDEDAVYDALQHEASDLLELHVPSGPALDDLPPLTTHADRTIGRAAELQRETKSGQLDVACLLAALLDTPQATARRAIARVIRDADIDDIARATLDWLHDQTLTYPQTLSQRFPRSPARKDDDLVQLVGIGDEEKHLAAFVDEIRDAPADRLPGAVLGLAEAAVNARLDPTHAIVAAVRVLRDRGVLSMAVADAWQSAIESGDATGVRGLLLANLPTIDLRLRDAVHQLGLTTASVLQRFAVLEPTGDRDVFGGLMLSDSARDAIGWATALAGRHTTTSVDSIMLLCGFVLHARPQPGADTSVAVLNDLQAQMDTGKRGIIARLSGYGGPLPRKPSGLPAEAQQSDDLRYVVGWAVELAHRIDARPDVRVRHLLAALLTPVRGRAPDVVSRLAREGVNVERLRAALNREIRESRPDDDLGAWADVLAGPQPAAPGSVLAGYHADDVGTDDRLDIKADVETLASVLAAKAVEPPISVGLFGDWGTGKSFFMNALERRMRTLEAATDANPGTSAYCRRIKHIRFNAWHFADANLWASLVTEIFDALAATDDERARAMLTELDTATRAREEAQARRDQAQAVRDALEQRVAVLERNAQEPVLLMQTTLENRAAAPAEADDLLAVVDDKARPDDAMKLRDVSALADDLAGIGGAARTVIRIAGWPRTLAALVVAALAFGLLQVLTGDALGTLAGIAAAVGALATALASPIARAREAAQAAATAAQVIRSEVRRAEVELAAQRAERERLTQQIIAADKDIAAAEREVEAITGGRLLARWVQERAAADDYRKYLGLVSLIRRDFVTLSTLMSKAEDPPFDRIVLYIDDLDRCPPTRVVEVLEAVHLLLALRLFVVVVAVDSRWLLRSLEIHYTALRQSDHDDEDDDYWVATPQNYLEKIFQIPYAVRPMAADGYCSLVDSMIGTTRTVPRPTADAGSREAAPSEGLGADGTESTGEEDREPADDEPLRPIQSETRAAPPPEAIDEGAEPALDLNPATLYLTDVELGSIKALAPLIKTPRATKRLVNTYRFARASLDPGELSAFVGDDGKAPGEHRAALILLAILIGFPVQAADLFQDLLDRDDAATTWLQFVELFASRQADRESFAAAVARAVTALSPPEALAPYARWAERVGRYSFHTSRLVVRGGSPASPD